MFRPESQRPASHPPPPPVSARRDVAYPLRMMGTLAASLLIIVVLARMPLHTLPARVGWTYAPSLEPIVLEDPRLKVEDPTPPEDAGVPITSFGEKEVKDLTLGAGTEPNPIAETAESTPIPALPEIPLERMVLAFADEMPSIEGGLGAYYINIAYPQSAIDAGVEGRLVLDFIVEPDGRATEVSVLQSLHPLCDSAAVQALRQTLFMPGRQNGVAVPVRMRLPVKFELLRPTAPDSTETAPSSVPLGR